MIFSHLITKPVLKISRISKEMSELQFEWQLDEQRTDELGILAKSLNYLSQKLNVVFSVENAGVHIPENSIPRLFDAFYRVEQSRSRKTGGSGLGLYIVQEILHQYGSECTVCNTQAGVKFSFII